MSEVEKIKKLRESQFRSDVRRNREQFILENARKLLNAVGYEAMNLPELAKISGYSKPTIYRYFPNKEDLLLALAIESAKRQISYFEKAITFDGRPREKLHGLFSLNTSILMDTNLDALLVHSTRARSKATPERQRELDSLDEQRIEINAGIIREAIEIGDLTLPPGVNEYKLMFTLMSTNFGAYLMYRSDSPVVEKWFRQLNFTDGSFGLLILDGIGWKPISGEWDYAKTINRFYQELFPELQSHRNKSEKSTS